MAPAHNTCCKNQAVESESTTDNITTDSINNTDISALKSKFETDGFVILSNKNNGGTSGILLSLIFPHQAKQI